MRATVSAKGTRSSSNSFSHGGSLTTNETDPGAIRLPSFWKSRWWILKSLGKAGAVRPRSSCCPISNRLLFKRPQRGPAFRGVVAQLGQDAAGDPGHAGVLDAGGRVVVRLAIPAPDRPRCPIWDTCEDLLPGPADGALADLQQVGHLPGGLGRGPPGGSSPGAGGVPPARGAAARRSGGSPVPSSRPRRGCRRSGGGTWPGPSSRIAFQRSWPSIRT